MKPSILLASKSPRRRELLKSLGYPFEVTESDVDESPLVGESPREMSLRLAAAKALQASSRHREALVIGADTVVDLDGTSLGKPHDRRVALRMLEFLNARAHLVHTGVALALAGEVLQSAVETTRVTFADLCEEELRDFADSGEGDDKAGGYAIQGRGAILIERIEGCYYNVVGLPLRRLYEMLRETLSERS